MVETSLAFRTLKERHRTIPAPSSVRECDVTGVIIARCETEAETKWRNTYTQEWGMGVRGDDVYYLTYNRRRRRLDDTNTRRCCVSYLSYKGMGEENDVAFQGRGREMIYGESDCRDWLCRKLEGRKVHI